MKEDNQLQRIDNFVIYQTDTAKVNVEVYFRNDTLWLTQKAMAQLFNKGRSTITEHLQQVFKQDELTEKAVCRDFRHTAADGKKYTNNMGQASVKGHQTSHGWKFSRNITPKN